MYDDQTRCSPPIVTGNATPENGASCSCRLSFARLTRLSRSILVKSVAGLAGILLFLCTSNRLNGAELKPKTVEAFDQYVQRAELRMHEELNPGGSFLGVDNLSTLERVSAYARLSNGEIIVHPIEAGLEIPGGMIHDWIGVEFIPNATLDHAVAALQNYSSYARIYSPEVVDSKILERDGRDFKVSIRLQQKSFVNVVLDVVEDVEYIPLGSMREFSCAHSDRITEVKDPGTSLEREVLSGEGRGYLWELDVYSWFLQTPTGVYLQLEVIGLSRDIPRGLKWLIKPYVAKSPGETLKFTLARTRDILDAATGQAAKPNSNSPSRAREEGLASTSDFSRCRD